MPFGSSGRIWLGRDSNTTPSRVLARERAEPLEALRLVDRQTAIHARAPPTPERTTDAPPRRGRAREGTLRSPRGRSRPSRRARRVSARSASCAASAGSRRPRVTETTGDRPPGDARTVVPAVGEERIMGELEVPDCSVVVARVVTRPAHVVRERADPAARDGVARRASELHRRARSTPGRCPAARRSRACAPRRRPGRPRPRSRALPRAAERSASSAGSSGRVRDPPVLEEEPDATADRRQAEERPRRRRAYGRRRRTGAGAPAPGRAGSVPRSGFARRPLGRGRRRRETGPRYRRDR